ncbi:hypothetical protein J6590_001833 [Homalodisca vitripennis]|nr:hypothetical protein J6590_001833 [Homalodisca vitripennis]
MPDGPWVPTGLLSKSLLFGERSQKETIRFVPQELKAAQHSLLIKAEEWFTIRTETDNKANIVNLCFRMRELKLLYIIECYIIARFKDKERTNRLMARDSPLSPLCPETRVPIFTLENSVYALDSEAWLLPWHEVQIRVGAKERWLEELSNCEFISGFWLSVLFTYSCTVNPRTSEKGKICLEQPYELQKVNHNQSCRVCARLVTHSWFTRLDTHEGHPDMRSGGAAAGTGVYSGPRVRRLPLLSTMDLLAAVVMVILAVALLAFLDTRKPSKYPPGPKWLPLFGSFWAFYFLLRQFKYTHLAWTRLSAKYGPLVGLRLGRDYIVLVSGQPLVREVLTREEFEGRPDGFLFRLRAFGKRLGVVFTDEAFGLEHRRFVLKHLREMGLGRSSMQDRITEETNQFINCLYDKCQEGPVNVRRVVNICILNNLWGMLAGKRFSIGDERLMQLLDYIHQSFSLQDMSGGLLNQMPFIRFIAPERSSYNKNLEILSKIYSFLIDTIDEHKKKFNPECVYDFIDVFLLEMKKSEGKPDTTFTDEQLLVVLLDLFMAGSDSTSNTLGFTVLYLLHFPHIQDRVVAEIEKVVDNSRAPTLQDRPHMPYTEALIMEVLRFTNIATVSVPHRAKRQVNLDSYIIPKDVTILVSLYSVHMDEQHWGDPHNFRPERFLDSENKIIHDDWLIPFGLGRRRCLGETLARPMLFLFLTSLLYHFNVTSQPGQPLPSMAPVDGAILAPHPFSCLLTPRRRPLHDQKSYLLHISSSHRPQSPTVTQGLHETNRSQWPGPHTGQKFLVSIICQRPEAPIDRKLSLLFKDYMRLTDLIHRVFTCQYLLVAIICQRPGAPIDRKLFLHYTNYIKLTGVCDRVFTRQDLLVAIICQRPGAPIDYKLFLHSTNYMRLTGLSDWIFTCQDLLVAIICQRPGTPIDHKLSLHSTNYMRLTGLSDWVCTWQDLLVAIICQRPGTLIDHKLSLHFANYLRLTGLSDWVCTWQDLLVAIICQRPGTLIDHKLSLHFTNYLRLTGLSDWVCTWQDLLIAIICQRPGGTINRKLSLHSTSYMRQTGLWQ